MRIFDNFYKHYFGTRSPWNAAYVKSLLKEAPPEDIKSTEKDILSQFDNRYADKKIYGMNFRPYATHWISKIKNNISFPNTFSYQADNRAILIDNAYGRVLPTEDPGFYDPQLAGEGYPFDNLQESALWAGTPAYIIAHSVDQAFALILTPDFIVWVNANKLARVNAEFVEQWSTIAKNKLTAITKNEISIKLNHQFQFKTYIGAVFPGKQNQGQLKILIPIKTDNGFAKIAEVNLNTDQAVSMPAIITPKYFARLIKNLIGRPYGWGGKDFYNDCSSELKNLFTPFAIWLPRHSSQQASAGLVVDMSASPPKERLNFLMKHGRAFLTLVYVGSHIVLYIGNYPDPQNKNHTIAFTYQNMWGLKPYPPIRRAVIGKAVFLPMPLKFKEDESLMSQTALKYFQLSFLDKLPPKDAPLSLDELPLQELMFPGITELVKERLKKIKP